MKISSERTKREIGFPEILAGISPSTPFGKKRMADMKPYLPGDEARLEGEFDRLEKICYILLAYKEETDKIISIFSHFKEISATFRKSKDEVLSTIELFEVKRFLLYTDELRSICERIGVDMPGSFLTEDTTELLSELDPEGNRLPTFYIYDFFSEKLAELRGEKKGRERDYRSEQKRLAAELQREYGITLTPKFDLTVARSDAARLEAAEHAAALQRGDEDNFSVTFKLRAGEKGRGLQAEIDELSALIEDEEFIVRKRLTKLVNKHSKRLIKNCQRIGELDFVMAKGIYAVKHSCVRPKIVRIHTLRIEEGRYLPLERFLKSKGQEYNPVSIILDEGVTCITGANMGGKTISMKLAGLVAMMVQYGLFAPCKSVFAGLSSSIHILIGDSQDIQRGLSSFGSEMEELNRILTDSGDRAMIFIDEIAGSTNPQEGRALTKSLLKYLSNKPYISLMTTHFDHVADGQQGIVNLRVRGLADADFDKLAGVLKTAGMKERIEILTRLMDFRLERVGGDVEIPREALRIAEILGLKDEIIEGAREILKADVQPGAMEMFKADVQ
ncbi:MAG: hypothetical protein LBL49_10570 [Clostridiales Family XIII bacterium]|jgi:dsDNA-specific endonuclease/ATPase MutS2|nr:hypothetical protein [Clostridiales Family XIII bacterium]